MRSGLTLTDSNGAALPLTGRIEIGKIDAQVTRDGKVGALHGTAGLVTNRYDNPGNGGE